MQQSRRLIPATVPKATSGSSTHHHSADNLGLRYNLASADDLEIRCDLACAEDLDIQHKRPRNTFKASQHNAALNTRSG